MSSLLRDEARERAALIEVTGYDVHLDLDQGERTFNSDSTISFRCRRPGAATFLELAAASITSITLNGIELDPATSVVDGRLSLPDLAADNEVRVVATMSYRTDGEGLHRSVDPQDGRHYVYGMSFLSAAPSIFACFDQPDLKAPYDLRVRAPRDWVVAANGAGTKVRPGEWEFATTPPMATYFVTVCAGPYHVETGEHDGIRLGIYVRATLAEQLHEQAEDIFAVTRQSFDYYHQLFGIRYPWGKYDQFFVPEFNAGAMENPGCITFRDGLIFRGAHTRTQLLTRANTISHEMAHMWFGDLVTMRWWDDLWLNESFAEYMAHRTLAQATAYDEAWTDFGIFRKTWGYGVDRSPATHPVAGAEVANADQALSNFDGISYAKGASALRQLALYVGDEAFIDGVREHLTRHRFGNATMADFLGAVESASGVSLGEWTEGWLRTAGVDDLALRVEGTDDAVSSVALSVQSPAGHPANRTHVVDVAAISDGVELDRVRAHADGPRTALAGLSGRARPKLLLPNASDITWATTVLDEVSLANVPDELAAATDPLVRLALWSALIGGADTGRVDPRFVIEAFVRAWPKEPVASLADAVGAFVPHLYLFRFLTAHESQAARDRVAAAGARRLGQLDPASPAALTAAGLVVMTTTDPELLGRWSQDIDRPAAASGDRDFGWTVLTRRAALGRLGSDELDAAVGADTSMNGRLAQLQAKAAEPEEAAKSWAWEQLFGETKASNYEGLAVARGLFAGFGENSATELMRSKADAFFEELPTLSGKFGDWPAGSIVAAAFPSRMVEPAIADRARHSIEAGGLSPLVERSLVDALDRMDRALVSLDRFGANTVEDDVHGESGGQA